MNDEEQKNLWQGLKCLWQEQKPSGEPALTADEQIAAMRKKMASLHRGLNKTDFWGSAVYAAVTVPFMIYIFTTPYFAARIGYLIIIGGMLFASWKSIRRRRSIPQPIADAPVMEWLKYDLAKVRQHAEDSRTLLWWYLLPFLIGMNVSTWGMPVELMAKIPISLLAALIAAVTYWLNQRVWRKQWLPMQQELESLLRLGETVLPPEIPQKSIMTKIILLLSGLLLAGSIGYCSAKMRACLRPLTILIRPRRCSKSFGLNTNSPRSPLPSSWMEKSSRPTPSASARTAARKRSRWMTSFTSAP